MANSITTTFKLGGPRIIVVGFFLTADGTGEFINSTLASASSLGLTTDSKIRQVWADLNGFYAKLTWKGTPNLDFLSIPNGHDLHWDFKSFNGVPNTASTPTGDILISSVGVATTSGNASIFLEIQND